MENRDCVTSKRVVMVPVSALTSAVGMQVTDATGQSDQNAMFGLDEELPSGIDEVAAAAEDARNSTALTGTGTQEASLRLELSSIRESENTPARDISFGSVSSQGYDEFRIASADEEDDEEEIPRQRLIRRQQVQSDDDEETAGEARAVLGDGPGAAALAGLGASVAGGDAAGERAAVDVDPVAAGGGGAAEQEDVTGARTGARRKVPSHITASLNQTTNLSLQACDCGYTSKDNNK